MNNEEQDERASGFGWFIFWLLDSFCSLITGHTWLFAVGAGLAGYQAWKLWGDDW